MGIRLIRFPLERARPRLPAPSPRYVRAGAVQYRDHRTGRVRCGTFEQCLRALCCPIAHLSTGGFIDPRCRVTLGTDIPESKLPSKPLPAESVNSQRSGAFGTCTTTFAAALLVTAFPFAINS